MKKKLGGIAVALMLGASLFGLSTMRAEQAQAQGACKPGFDGGDCCEIGCGGGNLDCAYIVHPDGGHMCYKE